ncbi:ribosomal-protein-alanine N-acetyltransferase [Rubrobacter marinus]|uniref:Ribosomal-protein-alanine N-acetyltransferase n=1 Tax=Rubrobacter marinus TaxID=2653852 RepID=A0A6G8PZ60_9ACTN|nr:ribosomal protein S18-alanine N-acetyltransferase [Rubrobacter marinus]QIN79482.1 ribosomal-protein-alanine N-acetyltransferase [Rubrobacter marinus]
MASGARRVPEPLVRPMLSSDLPVVLRIAEDSLPNPWSERIWLDELDSPFGLYLVLEEGGEVVGFVGVKHVADETHVMTVAVVPGRRGRGYARALVGAALDAPASRETRRVHLEVRPSNGAARTLYASLGFVETGVRPKYYGDEDAVLMTLELPGPSRRPSVAPLALAPRLAPPPEVLGGPEGLEEVEGRGEADQEAEEDAAGDKRVDGTPDHVDQKLQQQHQRDKREQ